MAVLRTLKVPCAPFLIFPALLVPSLYPHLPESHTTLTRLASCSPHRIPPEAFAPLLILLRLWQSTKDKNVTPSPAAEVPHSPTCRLV